MDAAENPDGRWRSHDYDDLVNRDKANLDIVWLKDESLPDSDKFPPAPEVTAREIVAEPEAALEQFRLNGAVLGEEDVRVESEFGRE